MKLNWHKRIATALITLIIVAISCSRPASEEMYVRTNQTDAYNRYVFELNMEDSLCVYDVGVYATLDCNDDDYLSFRGVPLHILWQSPTDKPYEEEVWLNRTDYIGGNFYTKQFRSSYRENLVPKEYGTWKIYISIPEKEINRFNLEGIGLRLTRKNNGTSQAKEI